MIRSLAIETTLSRPSLLQTLTLTCSEESTRATNGVRRRGVIRFGGHPTCQQYSALSRCETGEPFRSDARPAALKFTRFTLCLAGQRLTFYLAETWLALRCSGLLSNYAFK